MRSEQVLTRTPEREQPWPGFWLVPLLVVLLPFQVDTGLPFRLAPADLVLAACLVLGFRHLRFPRSVWTPWHLGLLLVFAMGMVVAFARTGQVTPYALWQKGAGLLVLLALYAVVTTVTVDWAAARRLLRLLVLSTGVVNLVAMTAFLVARTGGRAVPWVGVDPSRLAGFLVDPNAYGSLLVVALAVQLLTWLSPRPLVGGVPGAITIVTLCLGLLLTFSRSAWMGALVVLVASAISRPRLLLPVALAAVLVVLVVASPLGSEHLQFTAAVRRLPRIADRVEIINEALAMTARSPVLGTGLGVFYTASGLGKIVHNTLLWGLTEFGLVGLAVFSGFLGWFLLAGFRAWKGAPAEERAMVLALVVAHLAMLAVSMGIEALYQRHWWLVMALIAATHAHRGVSPGG